MEDQQPCRDFIVHVLKPLYPPRTLLLLSFPKIYFNLDLLKPPPPIPPLKKWIWPNKCTFLTLGRPDSVDWIKKLSILSDALSHPSDFARARQPLTWISRPEFAGALERGPAVAPGVFAGKKALGFFGFCKNCFIHRGSTLS